MFNDSSLLTVQRLFEELSVAKGKRVRSVVDKHGDDRKKRIRHKLDLLLVPLMKMSVEHGYALMLHGSLGYDVDMVAIPWSVEASEVSAVEFARAFEATLQEHNDARVWSYETEIASNPDYFKSGCPGLKPHGRLTWSFMIEDHAGVYIDLSVMPPYSKDNPYGDCTGP